MSKEIERRFRKFNKAMLPPKSSQFLFEIVVFEPTKQGQTIRLRKEGPINTFTIKQKIPGQKYPTEWETTVGDIATVAAMLTELGIKKHCSACKIS